jgi:carbon starvation protein CstA
VKMKREKFLWIPLIPTAWLLICTLTAGWQKLFHPDPKIGFIANARKFADAAARGEVLAPAKSMDDMSRVIFNNYLDAGLCALFVFVVLATVYFGFKAALAARRNNTPTAKESEYVAFDAVAR